jgi:hypothetical protein
MKIVHRIGFRATPSQRGELKRLRLKLPDGLSMPGGGDPLIAFDIAEDHAAWSQLRLLLDEWNISEGHVTTHFTKSEIARSQWLELSAWHCGYPQPNEESFGYRVATYDLSDWCERCGVGKRQRAPFQMKSEPKWGRHEALQLIWIYDEVFVTPAIWSSVFEPAGVGFRVVTNRGGEALKTVVQLVVKETVNVVTTTLAYTKCEACSRLKYQPITRGCLPPPSEQPDSSMARTAEWFGSGGQADHRLLLSRDLGLSLTQAKVAGVMLKPITGP